MKGDHFIFNNDVIKGLTIHQNCFITMAIVDQQHQISHIIFDFGKPVLISWAGNRTLYTGGIDFNISFLVHVFLVETASLPLTQATQSR